VVCLSESIGDGIVSESTGGGMSFQNYRRRYEFSNV
jgi:hypothetical protein